MDQRKKSQCELENMLNTAVPKSTTYRSLQQKPCLLGNMVLNTSVTKGKAGNNSEMNQGA